MPEKLLLLDGSMSSQLKGFGYNTDEHKPHWTFPANENLELMEKLYKSFLSLGVNIITTNTYHFGSTLDDSLPENANKKEIFIRNFKNTCALLNDLVNKSNDCQIWGSVGTLATKYHDLSEYNGAYMDEPNSMETAQRYYEEILQLFHKETEVRHLVFETIPSEKEALAALNVLKKFPDFQAVMSFTFKENALLRHGESIHGIAKEMSNCPQILGLGINCTDPANVLPVLKEVKLYNFPQIFVYPNSGDDSFLSDGETSGFTQEMISCWAMNGATAIGGCCGVDAKQLRAIGRFISVVNLQRQEN